MTWEIEAGAVSCAGLCVSLESAQCRGLSACARMPAAATFSSLKRAIGMRKQQPTHGQLSHG